MAVIPPTRSPPTNADGTGEPVPVYPAFGGPEVIQRESANCRGCGRVFVRPPGQNKNQASYFRCEDCNKQATKDLICLNLTCGASGVCSIS
ncbi:unnamed protein product [Phaeothamnion confervicola]